MLPSSWLNQRTQNVVSRSAVIIGVLSVLSRLIGVLRDRLLASTFGAGTVLDAYYAAFKVPDFIFNTFVLGALASALIPVFVHYRESEGRTQAFALAARVLNVLAIFLAVCAGLGALGAPWLVSLVAPGFDAASRVLTIELTRVMLITVVVFGVSNVLSSVLQAEQRFVAFGVAPVFYNLGIIAGLFWFVPHLGAAGLGWGVVLGSVLHFLVQLPAVVRVGFRWRPWWSGTHEGVRQVVRLLAPRTLGLIASQINQVITISFVSHLAVGSLAAFSLASNLHSFPINVFGVSLAVAVFPLLSQAVSGQQQDEFIRYFSHNVRRVLFYVLPLSVLFLVLRAQLVRVVLGSGAFDWNDTIRTAQVLGFLALAIVADSVLPLVARAFYALKDTRTPAMAAGLSIIVNLLLLYTLRPFGLAGVGVAYVCSSVTNVVVLTALLGKRIGDLGSAWVVSGTWRMALGSLAAAASAYGTLQLVAPQVDMDTFLGVATQGGLAGLAGCLSYLVVSLTLKLPEVAWAERWLLAAWRVVTASSKGEARSGR
ncbi:MAG: murein biosynthesis integral membrane protein MurJ [Candidatus Veblenbacteria bacterium]|nr:murein biosynthesis integral membrane protein MurJ [Candidatus Veblenbacteria bacterium]MDZ4229683.1 murein biosynthesis integral membrane protein MurJ [Candidatus Veblenbacteria bacterium]